MNDCTYTLFQLLRDEFPYAPHLPFEQENAQRLEQARARAKAFPSACRHDLFELTDSLNIQAFAQSHHAFLLGLDLGLSLSRELGFLQTER